MKKKNKKEKKKGKLLANLAVLSVLVMSRNLKKTPSSRMELFLEHPKHECLSQTTSFRMWWHIVFLILIFFIISMSYAQTLQEESAQLEQQLSDAGYDWLINYTLNESELSRIEVYENNQSRLVAAFSNAASEGFYQILLTNLSDEIECYDNETEILTLEEVDCEDYENYDEYIIDNGDKGLISADNKNYSYLILTSEFDSNNDNIPEISSFVPEKASVVTAPDSVLRTITAATFMEPSSVSVTPNLTVITYFTINKSDYLDYLNIPKKCYIQKWKFFADLSGKEEVLTLNQTSGEKEWQQPSAYQTFDHNGGMYRIELEDGSELKVSPEHRVYVLESNYSNSMRFNSSLGERTLTLDCSLRPLSPENIEQLNLSASAKYGESLKFNSMASGNLSRKSDDGTNVICSLISKRASFNSSSVSFVLDNIFPILLSSSYNINSGAMKSNLLDILFVSNTTKLFPLFINAEYITLTSTASSIYNLSDLSNLSYLFASAMFVSSVNSCTSSSDNFDLATIRSILTNLSSSSLIFLDTTNCQLIFFINASSLNSSGMRIDTSIINKHILDLYINLSSFELRPITEVYSSLQYGNEVYFLNEKNEPVKIKSIEKAPYSGKIYDVDVRNDIVLVRKNKLVCNEEKVDEYNKKEKEGFENIGKYSSRVNYSINEEVYKSFNYDDNYTNNKEKEAFDVAPTVRHFLPKYNYYNNAEYINFSDNNNVAEDAAVDLMVRRQSDKLDLSSERIPGSTPGRSAPSALSQNCRFVEGTPIWSGNSNNYSQNVFDLRIVGVEGSAVEFDYIVDPLFLVGDTSYASNDSNVTQETGFAHLNISSTPPYFDSLLAYWSFDGNYTNSTAYDYTHFNNDGTFTSGAFINTTGCLYGRCAVFDGVNDYINISQLSLPNLNINFTVSLWIYSNNSDNYGSLVVQDNGLGLFYRGSGAGSDERKVSYYFGGGGDHLSNTQMIVNNWHYITVVNNVTNLTIYLDGVLDKIHIPAPATKFNWIGNDNSGEAFGSSIDEVMIFNASLNSSQILEIYRNQSSRFATNGTQEFRYINFTTNNTVNISIKFVQNMFGSNLSAQINNGAIVNFTVNASNSGNILVYNMTDNLTAANLTIYYFAGNQTNPFYTPIMAGNITLESWFRDIVLPEINFTSPTPANGTTTTNTSIQINVSIVEQNLQEVKWNWNGTNYTMYNDSLVLMMNFNNLSAIGENQTHVVDVSKWSNNGTATNGANFTSSGKYSGAYQFDGVDDYLDVPSAVSLNNIWDGGGTISFWVKPKSAGESEAGFWITKSTYYTLFANAIHEAGQTGFEFNIDWSGSTAKWRDASTIPAISFDVWHNIVLVYNSDSTANDPSFYVDGVSYTLPEVVAPSGTRVSDAGNALQIGSNAAGSRASNGSIDEVAIWNRSLSASEIQQIYMSNLYKYNSTQWYLYVNQSKNATAGLDVGSYTYFASAKDVSGNENVTETRTVTIGAAAAPTSITACTNITSEGDYQVTANLSSGGNCININASNVDLNVQNQVIIFGAEGTGIGVNVSGRGTRLTNITIRNAFLNKSIANVGNANNWGIYVLNASNISIINNTIITNGSSTNYGIYFVDVLNSTINNNKINTTNVSGTSDMGIRIDNSLFINITRNTIWTNGSSAYGIYFVWTNYSTISANTIFTTGVNGHGVYFYPVLMNNTIIGNIINTTGTGMGLYFDTRANNNTIQGNVINTSGNVAYGIRMFGNSFNNITQNTIRTNGTSGYGIVLQDGTNFTSVSANTITVLGNTAFGIYIPTRAVNNTIIGNIINTTDTSGNGIYLIAMANNNSVLNNYINTSGSSAYGIRVTSSLYNNISSNNIKTNGTSGYAVYLTGGVNFSSVSSNTIFTEGASGIGIILDTESNNNTIASNIINTSGSTGYGVYAYLRAHNNTIVLNSINTSGTTGVGISAIGSNFNNITQNIIRTNGTSGYGIYILGGGNYTSVTSNTITTYGNAYGVYVTANAMNNTIQGNVINTSHTAGSAQGLYMVTAAANNTFYNNYINTSGGSSYGIFLSSLKDINNISSNTIRTYGSSGAGIFSSSNLSFIAGNFITTSGTSGFGIRLYGYSNNNTFMGNYINTSGASAYGFYFDGNHSNSTIIRNIINTSGSSGFGIQFTLGASVFNNVSGNTIITSGSSSSTIWLSAANFTEISNNSLTTTASSAIAIRSYNSQNNSFISNIINTTGGDGYGFFIANSSNSSFIGNIISTLSTSGYSFRIYQDSDWNFIAHNNITRSLSDAFRLESENNLIPENNNITNNSLMNIAGYGLNILNESINGTYLVNQIIENYSFGASGAIVNFLNLTFGEIKFLRPINGSGLNLSKTIVIRNNSAFVNTTDAGFNAGLNKSANVTLYGIASFAIPSILRDGAACPSSICANFTALTAGTVSFNATGWSNYSIGDTPGTAGVSECMNLTSNNTVYTQTANIVPVEVPACINITASNVTFNGNGYSIANATYTKIGMFVTNAINVTIKNALVNVSNNSIGYGIFFNSVNSSSIFNNTFARDYYSIYLTNSRYNNISGNIINSSSADGAGIFINSSSSNNTIISNLINTTAAFNLGIYLSDRADNNTVIHNNVNTSETSAHGLFASGSLFNNLSSNTVKTVGTGGIGFYIVNGTNYTSINSNKIFTIGTNAYGIYFYGGGMNNTISGNTINTSSEGVRLDSFLGRVRNITITDNIINTSSDDGITIIGEYINISRNNITTLDSIGDSILLSVNYTSVTSNIIDVLTIASGGLGAIHLTANSYNNTIAGNIINITAGTGAAGILIRTGSHNNTIVGNNVNNSGTANQGLRIFGGANFNNITSNTFNMNGSGSYGIWFDRGMNYSLVTGNRIIMTGNNSYGIFIFRNAMNSTFIGNNINTTGNMSYGILLQNISNSSFKENTIETVGFSGYSIYIEGDSDYNLFKDNNVTRSISDAFRFNATGGAYPENNNLTNNTLTQVAGFDINFETASINGTILQNQIIGNYSFTGIGGIIHVINTTAAGEIKFLRPVNGSGLNLSETIVIRNNSVFVNTTDTGFNAGLNKSVNITLYGIASFAIPSILRDGAACPSSICANFTALTAGTVSFNVTGWSNYSIADTPGTAGVSGCMNLTSNNTIYTQTANIVPVGTMASCINITASNVTFNGNGYWISNATFNQSVVFANNQQNITIRNANISNNMGDGLTFDDVNYSLIINGTFDSNDDGISFSSSQNNTLLDNKARNNTQNGIIIGGLGNFTIVNNTLLFNSQSGLKNVRTSNISNNIINNNSVFGIDTSGGDNVRTIEFNKIENNSLGGIRLFLSTTINITNNTINNNGGEGGIIVITGSGNFIFDNNTLNYNTLSGIHIKTTSGLSSSTVSSNIINFNNFGINVTSGLNRLYIFGNIINNNSQNGIMFLGGIANFSNNTINNNSLYGIYIDYGSEITLTNNTVNLNKIGIYINSSGIISNNTANDNTQTGIYINGSYNNVSGNVLINNTVAAINLTNSQNNTIINNSGDGNGYGIGFDSGSSGNQIFNNIIRNSRKDALFINDAASGNNTFANMTLLNTNNSFYDIRFASSGTNNTRIIDSNFSNYTFTGTGGIVIFRHSSFGQVEFLKNISGNNHNLSLDVQIRNNSAFVNGSKSGLNQTANITLYGLRRDLINPRIIRAGETCTQAMGCYNFTSLNAGTVSFNATGWSNYSISETPAINFSSPTFTNNTKILPTGGAQVNISINSTGLSEFTWHWNGTNYTMYNDSLVLMMNFENLSDLGENQTFVRDNSKYGNNGTVVNGATYNLTNAKYGKAMEFDGVNDYVDVGNSNSWKFDTGDFAVSFWMKANVWQAGTDATEWMMLMGNGNYVSTWDGFHFGRTGAYWAGQISATEGGIMLFLGNGVNNLPVGTLSALSTGTWYHIVGGRSNVTTYIYLNGVQQQSTSINYNITVNRSLTIGKQNDGTYPRHFNGTIDEVMIWNRTLSADEINQTYYSGLYRLGNTSWEFYTNKTNLTRGSYTYQGIVKDGAGTQNQTEWRTLRVNNLPTATLSTPTIWNQTTNRTPSFTWTSNDADSDALTYELNLTCYVTTGGGCSGKGSDERYVQSISGTTHNLARDLQYLIDYNNYYNWSVRAYDGSEYGAWTSMFGLNISALVAISLPVSTIDFGLLTQGQSKNTTAGDPAPFRIQNDGNSFANITINGTNLWSTKANPDRFYQFKIANNSAENGSFSWSQSLISFRNMSGPAATLLAIVELNYTDATDSGDIDLLVEDPASEPAGAKQSNVTFTASLGE